MLSKFLNSLKPKEYSVQVMRDSTSQSAVRRIKRTRTTSPLRTVAALTLAFSFVGGGLASAAAASAVTAQQAHANVIADAVCQVNADDKESGSWNGGSNVYGSLGGREQWGMSGITKKTVPSDAAFAGQSGTWNESGAPSQGKYLTAYEKYGMNFPKYDAWVPAYAEKEVNVQQVDTSKGSYTTGDGKLPTKGGTKLSPGESPLISSDVGSCMALLPTASAAVANIIATIPKFVMGASIELYATAYGSSISQEGSILHEIGNSLDKFITQPGGLRDSLFVPFILPLILIGAIWVGYVGIVKRAAMQAVQSTGWMILAIALGAFFLAQPTLISKFVDETVATVQTIVNDAVLSGSNTTDMCNISGSGDPKETIRETKCTIWHSTIFTTWSAGQFGQAANSATANGSVLTQEAGRDVLGNSSYKVYYGSNNGKDATTWPQFMLDRQVTTKSPELSEVAWAQLSGQGNAAVNNEWAGGAGMISSSIIMFFGAGASSAVLFVYGFALLIYQLMMISAVLMSPFFFLFGIVPNWGRRVLMRYAELLTSLAVKRIVTGTLLALYLLFYNLIVGGAEFGMLILKIIIIFALALFFITSRTKFVKMFADNINFGGNKSVGLPGNKAVALTAGIGAGLLGGGLIGAAIVGHKTRKDNKDTEGKLKDIKIEGSPTADIKTPPRGPNSGGDTGQPASPMKTVGKVVNGAQTAQQAVDLAKNLNGNPTVPTPTVAPSGAASTGTPQGAPSAPNTANGATMPSSAGTASQGAPAAGNAASNAGRAGSIPATGPNVAPQAAKSAGGFIKGGAGAATVTPAGAATAGSGAAAGTGASAGAAAGAAGSGVAAGTGTAGVAAGGAAAAGTASGAGIAAGGAAAGGTVAAGAAAGSVVPVVGTAVGAAAAAAVIAKQKSNASNNNGGKSGQN